MKSVSQMLRLSVVTLALTLAGCASSAPQVKQRYFWPTPPETPRIEWLGAYNSTSSLVLTQNPFAFIVGEESGDSLINPAGIASDGAGRVFVGDLAKRAVMVFDFNTRETHLLGGNAATDLFKNPSGIDFDSDGNIYVADLDRKLINVFDKTEKPLRSIDVSGFAKSVGFIAIDKTRKRIVIPDVRGHKVHIVDYDGKLILTLDQFRDNKEGFGFPTSVAVDANGNIIVADTMNARLVRFTPDGAFINFIGQRGDAIGDIAMVKGVAVDSEGHIYITDVKSNRIQVFNDKGEALLALGRQSTNPAEVGGFYSPTGIYIDKNDGIYITDKIGRRFQVFQYMNSRYIAEHPIASEAVVAKPVIEDPATKAGGKGKPGAVPAKK